MSPIITIGSPYMVGEGNFIETETITGSSSGVTAIVKDWNYTTGSLSISNATGSFIIGEIITGSESNATYQLKSSDSYNTTNQYPDNSEIEIEADKILDFSESNPFGNP